MRIEVKECRQIVRGYLAKVYFRKLKKNQAGYCDCQKSFICINSDLNDRATILSVLFHELAHLECYRKNKWANYHRSELLKDQMNCGLKAERYCDRWAEMELYNYDKRIKYVKFYSGDNKELKDFLEDFLTNS